MSVECVRVKAKGEWRRGFDVCLINEDVCNSMTVSHRYCE